MPELPDILVYQEHLERRIRGARLVHARVVSPNLLRTAEPPLESAAGRVVTGVQRIGKRIVVDLEPDLHLVVHLMIAGRLHWKDPGAAPAKQKPARVAPGGPVARGHGLGRNGLAAFEFTTGTLSLTEASTQKRASLHVVAGEEALRALDPGGIDVLSSTDGHFAEVLRRGNHTLKRALTDPRHFSGIGNAYSDEILHRARLSPMRLSRQLDNAEMARLHDATRAVLVEWIDRLRAETGEKFPEGVTAFRNEMAVHGKYRQPCPVCGVPVQRIVYADHETNYCARCQTEGRLLKDRGLSRLLRDDWPRTLEELEE